MNLRSVFLLAPLALVLSLTACGGSSQGGQGSRSQGETKADVQQRAFLEAMVPHHRSAIEMAEAAEGRLEAKEIRHIQGAITEAQTEEIAQMERIHKRLYGSELKANEGAHEHLGMSAQQAGMGQMMGGASIRRARPPVDKVFIDQMVPHHQGAIRMAEAVLKTATDRELRSLAEDIIKAQKAEVKTMNEVREREFGGPAPTMHGGMGAMHEGH